MPGHLVLVLTRIKIYRIEDDFGTCFVVLHSGLSQQMQGPFLVRCYMKGHLMNLNDDRHATETLEVKQFSY